VKGNALNSFILSPFSFIRICHYLAPHLNKILLIALLLTSMSFSSVAQNTKHGESWSEINLVTKAIKRNLFQLDVYYNTISDTQQVNMFQYKANTGLGGWYHFFPTSSIKLSAYFGWEHYAEIEGQSTQYERFRATLFANFNNRVNRATLSHRLGIDELWTEQGDGGYKSKYRLRYRFRIMAPLNKTDLVKGALYAFVIDELFFNTKKSPAILNQNRIQLALGYCITDNIQFETSYFFITSPDANSNRALTHVLQFSLVINNIFLKKSKE
jgi:hypothetical protein